MADKQGRHARRYLLYLPVLVASILSATGCSPGASSGGDGPLGTLMQAGKPDFFVVSLGVTPGQPADGEAFVVNSANAPVTITAVSAIDVPGAAAAHLADLAIQAGTHPVGAQRGWPPQIEVQLKPAIGARLPHGQSGIIYGVTGQVIGRDYAIAGVRISYTFDGRPYTAIAWGGDLACVVASLDSSTATCNAFYNTVNAAIENMSGLT
jgi:hypothetical protein